MLTTRLLLLVVALGISSSAIATYNATAVGGIRIVQQMSTSLGYLPETMVFTITNQPNVPGATFQ